MKTKTIKGVKHVLTAYAYPDLLEPRRVEGFEILVRAENHPTRPARETDLSTWWEPVGGIERKAENESDLPRNRRVGNRRGVRLSVRSGRFVVGLRRK